MVIIGLKILVAYIAALLFILVRRWIISLIFIILIIVWIGIWLTILHIFLILFEIVNDLIILFCIVNYFVNLIIVVFLFLIFSCRFYLTRTWLWLLSPITLIWLWLLYFWFILIPIIWWHFWIIMLRIFSSQIVFVLLQELVYHTGRNLLLWMIKIDFYLLLLRFFKFLSFYFF